MSTTTHLRARVTATVGAAAVATAIATGCSAASETTARITPPASAPRPESQAHRMREYRQTIIALYRMPGAER
jgi:hypothetical protein